MLNVTTIIEDMQLVMNFFSRNYTTMVFWIFGYGSLVWNPGLEYDEKVIGFIKDYRRVFDLGKCFFSVTD